MPRKNVSGEPVSRTRKGWASGGQHAAASAAGPKLELTQGAREYVESIMKHDIHFYEEGAVPVHDTRVREQERAVPELRAAVGAYKARCGPR